MKLSSLAPNPKNPRKITDKKLEMLKASMREFGPLDGVLYNRRTKRLFGGHQRQKGFPESAVKIEQRFRKPTAVGTVAVGYVTIEGERYPYREVDWTEDKEKAGNIAANRGAGEWDLPQLSEWLIELDHANFDLNLTMFDAEERENIVVPVTKLPPSGDPDHVPSAPKEATTKRGDLWKLGDHRLLCGDSTDPDHLDALLAKEKPGLIFTDPPYGIDYQDVKKAHEKIAGDAELSGISSLLALLLTFDCPMFICCNWKCFSAFESAMIEAEKPPKACIVWDKGSRIQNLDKFGKQHEFVFYHGPFGGEPTVDVDVWQCKREVRADHPTSKPVELIERALGHFKETLVLDLFGGSGSTLVAAEKMGKRCLMMELDPIYCDVIVKRWEVYTGRKAELLSSGSTGEANA